MRVLITGVGGFVGGHLIRELLTNPEHLEIVGTSIESGLTLDPAVDYHQIDLRDNAAVQNLIAKTQPDHIYHLAAQAFVPRSFEDPWETLENNIRAQLNIIQACLALNIQPRTLVISSAEIYGTVNTEELPLTEESPLRPSSPYSVSKVTQDMLGLQYYLSHQLPIMRARPFNHFGPGQNERFVAPAFALQIARIEAGQQEPVIEVGNLSAYRDFTDVRDIVRAYRLIMQQGLPGDVYNIATGKAHSIQQLLETLLNHAQIEIETRVATQRLRPVTIPILQGDAAQLQNATGWQPTISFEDTLRDVLDESRQRIRT